LTAWIAKWLKIYEDEINVFLWTTLLYFIIRIADIILGNFAEAAFLKRYGVQYLPVVYMVNAVSTFFVMGFITGLLARFPGSSVLSGMLIVTGVSIGCFRFIIPLDIDLVYPVLWVLKAQYEVLLGLVFWNLANDLFNTRQSKRIFPIITAGGVLGAVLAGYATPLVVRLIPIDNLMFLYLILSVSGAATVHAMGRRFPTLLLREEEGIRGKGKRSIVQEFKRVIPMMKESILIKILVVLSLVPNMVIPIINYQFNFAADQTFATEGGIIKFFGYFKGSMNVISLIILLFVGRIYSKWGIPVALMFHPFNYVIAFLGYLFHFNIVTALYAQISTTVLRNTINNPARSVLMGLIPSAYRAVIRPFLRGTAVRIGTLAGSGIIMIIGSYFHPRFLSVAAIILMFWWLYTNFLLKKHYPKILLDLISKNIIDLRSMEGRDIGTLFSDGRMKSQLREAFRNAKGEDCLWYADVMASLRLEGLDKEILAVIRDRDENTQIGLLERLSPEAGREAAAVLKELADPEKPELMKAILKTSARISSQLFRELNLSALENSPFPLVKAYALGNLYAIEAGSYGEVIDRWLSSDSWELKEAGVIAAGQSRRASYITVLQGLISQDPPASILPSAIRALRKLKAPQLNEILSPFLSHQEEAVRLAALECYELINDEDIRKVIDLLNDPSKAVGETAIRILRASSYRNAQVFVEALTSPYRKVREGIFELLGSLEIKEVDFYRFARERVRQAYLCALKADASSKLLPQGFGLDLLIEHLRQERRFHTDTVLRFLAARDRSGRMRIIWRGISSSDARQRSNAAEALEDSMDKSLAVLLMPLVEELPDSEILSIGKKRFRLPRIGKDRRRLLGHLLRDRDWVTVCLTLYCIRGSLIDASTAALVEELRHSANPHVRLLALQVLEKHMSEEDLKEEDMAEELSIPDKIILLKGIKIFEGLTVSELAAVASVTQEKAVPAGETVIREGEAGDSMYLVVSGEVSVSKATPDGKEIELDKIKAGDYFGEMALFDESPRSATVKAISSSRFLVLHKKEFTESVREYPQIALQICKVLSRRMRNLQGKIKELEGCS
jgi:hypothetical protein